MAGGSNPGLGRRRLSPATPPQLRGPLECASLEVQGDNFPVHHVHSVELVLGAPGQINHVKTRAFESNYASPPKGRTIGELLEQIVFVVHGSPFLATL
jgi:hypothetical protein